MKNTNQPKSSSYFQASSELKIIEDFLKHYHPSFSKSNQDKTFTLETSSKTKMQLDLYLKEAKVIGEVYVTELPFNSRRKRKFQSDILKMITFEKQTGEHYDKYYFLTADKEKLNSIHTDVCKGKFYKHTREKSLIGKDTWLNLTLESFGIELYYYCIGNEFFKELKEIRIRQKEGMDSNPGLTKHLFSPKFLWKLKELQYLFSHLITNFILIFTSNKKKIKTLIKMTFLLNLEITNKAPFYDFIQKA